MNAAKQNNRGALNELALFSGAGGGILGGHLLGWRCICAVEIEEFARNVLLARQLDGQLPRFPIWDDVTTFDGCEWRGRVDVVSGGFPCQDISTAGRGKGIDGDRSGLWTEMARIVGEIQPRFVLVENVPTLTVRGVDRVLGDLASLGYDAEWGIFSAADAGAKHKRERLWILAHPLQNGNTCAEGNFPKSPLEKTASKLQKGIEQLQPGNDTGGLLRWLPEPELDRMVDGVADRVDKSRMSAIGNGQIPRVVQLAWETLIKRFE